MTFYEAALRVLEAAGRPLHFQEITERSIQQSLLSHVGKTPELTMLSRLLAMARRKTDRKVVVTSKDTFALADWALPEEPDALALTALAEVREEENVLPLRPSERHPEARQENVRVAGRGAERKRRREDEDEGRRPRRKFPPISEVVFEVLSDARVGLRPSAIAAQSRERELAGEEMSEQEILTALLEDNQRRIDAGRRPQFVLDPQSGAVTLERGGVPSASSGEIQAAFAAALGIAMEAGRPLLPKARPTPETSSELAQAHAALKAAGKEARRATARALRRRLAELDGGTFEKTMVKVLHGMGFRELKVARRSKDGPLLIARKREASLELRYGIRLLHASATVDARAVQDLRRDLGHQSAHVGLIATPGDLRGEARAEAVSSGPLVFLWCGEALADKYLEARVGVVVTHVESYELDDRFFEAARQEAQEAQLRREERLRQKRRPQQEREEDERQRPVPGEAAELESPSRGPETGEPAIAAPESSSDAPLSVTDADADDEGDDGDDDLEEAESAGGEPRGAEGSTAAGQATAAAGERRRRRRRRRGRRGRGRGQEGTSPGGGESSASEPQPEPPAPPAPSGAGEGSAA